MILLVGLLRASCAAAVTEIVAQSAAPASLTTCSVDVSVVKRTSSSLVFKISTRMVAHNRTGAQLNGVQAAIFGTNGVGDILWWQVGRLGWPGYAKPIAPYGSSTPLVTTSTTTTQPGAEQDITALGIEQYVCAIVKVFPKDGAIWEDESIRRRLGAVGASDDQ